MSTLCLIACWGISWQLSMLISTAKRHCRRCIRVEENFFQGSRREEAAASALSNETMGNSLLLIRAKASHMSIVEEICPTCNGLFGSSSTN